MNDNYMKTILSGVKEWTKNLTDDAKDKANGTHKDWNENDPTKPGYIENRPFYTGDPVETVLVEESTVSFVEQGGLYMAQFQSTFEATAGEVYKVSWDGTVYECTCVDFPHGTIIGNLSLAGEGSDTGEPFVMGIMNGVGITIVTADTSASHTFSISGFVPEVVKIDEKYLPEAAFRVRNLDTTKSYSTEEIEEIYKSARSGSVVYYLNGSIVTELLYTANESLTCVLSDRSSISISPIDNVWDFSNPKTEYPSAINFTSRYYPYANITTGFTKVVGGIDASGYELVSTNLAGFIGSYIEAEYSIVLKVKNVRKYLYITANENGEIEVSIRAYGQASGGVKTTLFKNGDDSMILKSSTEGSTKKFKITVDDSGAITATEVV